MPWSLGNVAKKWGGGEERKKGAKEEETGEP